MFFVVHFETWFQTIPENWVDKARKIIHWPTEKGSVLTMWIKKEIPFKSHWKEYNYDYLFGPFGEYECNNFTIPNFVIYISFLSCNFSI